MRPRVHHDKKKGLFEMRGMPAVDRPEYAVPTINYLHFTTELYITN
jgi:hypothetical protein